MVGNTYVSCLVSNYENYLNVLALQSHTPWTIGLKISNSLLRKTCMSLHVHNSKSLLNDGFQRRVRS